MLNWFERKRFSWQSFFEPFHKSRSPMHCVASSGLVLCLGYKLTTVAKKSFPKRHLSNRPLQVHYFQQPVSGKGQKPFFYQLFLAHGICVGSREGTHCHVWGTQKCTFVAFNSTFGWLVVFYLKLAGTLKQSLWHLADEMRSDSVKLKGFKLCV